MSNFNYTKTVNVLVEQKFEFMNGKKLDKHLFLISANRNVCPGSNDEFQIRTKSSNILSYVVQFAYLSCNTMVEEGGVSWS